MIISYITLTQVVFTIILLASKKPFRLADKILIAILADIAFIIVGSIFRNVASGSLFNYIFTHISLGPFAILLLPLIYIYVKTSIVESHSFDRSLHFPSIRAAVLRVSPWKAISRLICPTSAIVTSPTFKPALKKGTSPYFFL